MQKKLFKAEIAFAMEMMSEGYQQKHIAAALSVTPGSLRDAIRKAMINGAKEKPVRRTTTRRIKHTNKRAGAVLAAQGSSPNLPRKKQGLS